MNLFTFLKNLLSNVRISLNEGNHRMLLKSVQISIFGRFHWSPKCNVGARHKFGKKNQSLRLFQELPIYVCTTVRSTNKPR